MILLLTGCATVRQSAEQCEDIASSELAAVFLAYEHYRDGGLRARLVNDARRALERARYTLYGEGGLPVSATCPPTHHRRTYFRELADDFEAASALVTELEDVRGVRFVELRGDHIVWANATTGAELSPEIAGKL